MTSTEMLRTMADRPDETWRREETTSFDDLAVIGDLERGGLVAFTEYGGKYGMYARWKITPAGRATLRRRGAASWAEDLVVHVADVGEERSVQRAVHETVQEAARRVRAQCAERHEYEIREACARAIEAMLGPGVTR